MATFFVNKTSGNDSNSGTSASPVATLTQAFVLVAAAVAAGPNDHGPHEIIIQDGSVYQEGGLGVAPAFNALTQVRIMALTGSDSRPVASPTVRGSGSSGVQDYAFFCGRQWIIRGITFDNWIINPNEGVVQQRDVATVAQDQFLTVEDCTFRDITGSCINIDGNDDPGLHLFQRNKFYRVNSPSSSGTNIIHLVNNNKAKIINNVFYDIEFGHANANLISAGGTRGPATIISHNTFGTSSCPQLAKPNVVVDSQKSKFEYNIMNGYDTVNSFADIKDGEANYNLFYNLTGSSGNAPFGQSSGGPSGSSNNITGNSANALFRGPLSNTSDADYRLAGTNSPAFDAAVGSSDVTEDYTGFSRSILDKSALATGIFDIGAYELTGLFSEEQADSLPQHSANFTINRMENSKNQWKRAKQEGNSTVIGHDVDQLPATLAINGAIPSFIRGKSSASTQETGKKG